MIIAQHIFKPYLDPEEKILAVCRRHPFIISLDLARIAFFGFAVPLFLYYLFPSYWLFFGAWLLISCIRVFRIFTIWFHDVLLITSSSLMDVMWNGVFNRTSSRLEYPMIEGVTIESKGFFHVVLNFGDVTVQGAGGGSYICLKDAINPKKVEKLIMMYQEKFVTDQTLRDSESLKALLTSLIRQHIQSEETENVNS